MQRHALSILALALLLGASLVAPVADASQGNGNGGGQDGDGNQGHGNNDGKCDPDNPGKPKDCAGDAKTWYKDGDADGFGDHDQTTTAADAPEGYVATGGDCDDGDADTYPGAPELEDGKDNDCDGIVAEGSDNDSDGYYTNSASKDCNDDDPDIHPGATEIPDNDVDEDCNGLKARTYFIDHDGDSFGSVDTEATETPAAMHVTNSDDCDDTNAAIHPGATEIPDDGIDQDCDGADLKTWFRDQDGDGYGTAATTVTANTAPAGYVATGTDCDDSNAAVTTDCTDADQDGTYAVEDCDDTNPNVAASCTDTDGDGVYLEAGDCDDGDASVYPGAPETVAGKDSDCDGTVASIWYLDADSDGYGRDSKIADEGHVAAAGDCDDNDSAVYPSATEISDDGIDQDCDGIDLRTWYQDADGDGVGDNQNTTQANTTPEGYVATGGDCDDGNAAVTTDCTDADNDGTYAVEDCDDANPAWALDCDDTDGDGVLDVDDVCPGFDDSVDLDGDGIPDGCDDKDNRDSDNDGVQNWADQCPGFDDSVDLDGDGIPDDCDPEVTLEDEAATSTNTTEPVKTNKTRYLAVNDTPEPSSQFTLGDGTADTAKTDLVKTATATLKNETTFKQGELESFRLQVITRQAEVEHAGGEVDVDDLQTRVKAKAKTVVVDVIAEGTLKGQPITSPKDVVDNLDLTFAMPVSHFNENGLDPQKAILHEYSFNHSSQKNEFVHTLQLSQPVLEGDLYIYQIILKDFSSFVFEAESIPAVTSGGGGGAGRGGGGPAPAVEPEPEVPVTTPYVEPEPIAEAKIGNPLDQFGAGQQLQPGTATAAAPPAASYWQLWLAALLVIGGLWFLAASARRTDEAYPTAPTMQDRIRAVRRRAERAIRLALLPMRLRREFGSEDSEARRVAELKAVLHPHRK